MQKITTKILSEEFQTLEDANNWLNLNMENKLYCKPDIKPYSLGDNTIIYLATIRYGIINLDYERYRNNNNFSGDFQ